MTYTLDDEYQAELDADWVEFKRAEREQEAIDWAAATVEDLCLTWGPDAVASWVEAWRANQEYEAKQRNRRFWQDGDPPSQAYCGGGYDHCGCSHDMPDEF